MRETFILLMKQKAPICWKERFYEMLNNANINFRSSETALNDDQLKRVQLTPFLRPGVKENSKLGVISIDILFDF